MDRKHFEKLVLDTLHGLDIPDVVTLEGADGLGPTLFLGEVPEPDSVNAYAVVAYGGGSSIRTAQAGRYAGTFIFDVFLHAAIRDDLMTMIDVVEEKLLALAPAGLDTGPEATSEGANVSVLRITFDG